MEIKPKTPDFAPKKTGFRPSIFLRRMLFFPLFALVACAVSCGSAPPTDTASGGTTSPDIDEGLILTECSVVYAEDAPADIVLGSKQLRNALIDRFGSNANCRNDGSDPSDTEILVGDTSRPESTDVRSRLGDGRSYRIERIGTKIIIVGSDTDCVICGCSYFINHCLTRSENKAIALKESEPIMNRYSETPDSKTLWDSDLCGFEILSRSTVYGPTQSNPTPELTYSRIIELSHNGENNGVLIATGESLNVESYLIHRSDDGGQSWKTVGTVRSAERGMIANWQPMLYELPVAIGKYPEGTLLLAGCTRNPSGSQTAMTLYASTNLGKSWNQIASIAEGGGFDPNGGLSSGLWEPFLICGEDGRLYCFYSDETDCRNHSQMIVFRSSEDGIHWSDTVRVVACENQSLRPGMPSVAKIAPEGGKTRYMITYEMVGQDRNPTYFKITDDLSDWGNPSELGKLVRAKDGTGVGSAPYCAWISAGGPQGTLIVTAKNTAGGSSKTGTEWMISHDCAKSWQHIENPLPYPSESAFRFAYSPCIFPSADRSRIYYVNNVPAEELPEKAQIALAVIDIHG